MTFDMRMFDDKFHDGNYRMRMSLAPCPLPHAPYPVPLCY